MGLSLGQALSHASSGLALTRSAAIHRVVSNRTGFAGGTNNVSNEGNAWGSAGGVTFRSVHTTGSNGGFRRPRFLYGGFEIVNSEQNLSNRTTQKPALEIGGVNYPITVAGQPTFDVDPGVLLLSDPVNVDVADAATLAHRNWCTVASGGRIATTGYVRGNSYLTSNGNPFVPTAGADVAYGTGTLSSGAPVLAPYAILGIPTSPSHKAVAILGDSIGAGTNDTQVNGFLGFVEKGLTDQGGVVQLSKAASTIEQFNASRAKMMTLAPYLTSVIVQRASNDIYLLGRNLATAQASAIACWSAWVQAGVAAFQTTVLPRVSGTVSSTMTQSIATPSANTVRIAFNGWLRDGAPMSAGAAVAAGTVGALRAGAGGHPLTGWFEVADLLEVNAANVFTRDGGYIYCGPANNTAHVHTDGIHPIAAGTALLAPGIVFAQLR